MNGKKGEPSIMENVVLIILPILLELVVALELVVIVVHITYVGRYQ